mmetsp:Transcript_7346/g.31200  ORF Transcript_7346/g.31200 Transcript_7346/m.31200 type:complete len:1115 (+) Transcript_7346:42-3386(+)
MTEEDAGSILIPVRDTDEFVEVRIDELPEDCAVLLEILEGELAPLSVWLDVAVAYFKQGRTQAFLDILNKATEKGAEEHYRTNKHDRIVVLNALASYYSQLASRTQDKAEKQKCFAEATQHYNRADKIDIQEGVTWVGKGVLYLQKSDKQRALREFDMVLSWQAENTPALLGRACALYQRGQYKEALKCYKKVLTTNPACPPSVRFGLGLCYFKLDNLTMAQRCFERVLELDPDSVEANVALAVMDYNKGNAASVRQGTERLTKAYAVNPQHPRVLNYLANHFFYKGEYGHVETMATKALSLTDVPKINGESCFHLARCHQAQEDYDAAFDFYTRAIQHWPSFPLAQFGLAQMCLHKGNTAKATKLLQHVLKQYPDNYEAMKMLASLYVGTSNEELSRQFLNRITEQYPTDWESWIELGQLLEKANPTEALKAFETAARIQQKAMAGEQEEGQSAAAVVPTQLLNNIAVLKHKTGDFEGAEKVYIETITRAGAQISDFSAENITTSFNLARLYEDTKRYKEAEFLYSGILKERPDYADCYLRLGCISRARGDLTAAEEWFSSTFNVDVNHVGGWTMLGNLHMKKNEWKKAQEKFEHILKNVNKRDAYALLAMGNIYLNARQGESAERRAKNLKYALDHFYNVLQRQKNNLYAVNGLGIVLAHKGLLAQARTCFMRVWEAVASGIEVPDVWTNLGNVQLLQGNYSGAAMMYENCLAKFYNNANETLFLLLANAHYEAGKLDECLAALDKGLAINSESAILRYNRAICLKTFASTTIRRKSSELTVDLVRLALERAKEAAGLFAELAESGKEGGRKQYSTTKCGQMQEYCGELERAAELLLAKVEKRHNEAEEKRKENLRLAEELRKVMLKKKLEQDRKKEEERLAREEKARKDLEKLSEAKAAWESAGTRKRRQPDSGFDDSDSEDEMPGGGEEEAGGEGKKKGKKAAQKKKKAPAKKKRKKKDEAGDEDGGPQGPDSDEDMPSDDDFDDSFAAMRDARNPRLKQLADKMRQQEEAEKQKLKNRRRRPRLDDDEVPAALPDSDEEMDETAAEEKDVREKLTSLLDGMADDEIPKVTYNLIVSKIAEQHGDASLLRKHKRFAKTVATELLAARAAS